MPSSRAPGVYVTTITQPAAFASYLIEQLCYLVTDYRAEIAVALSSQEIPYPYVLDEGDELGGGGIPAEELAHHFPGRLALRRRR